MIILKKILIIVGIIMSIVLISNDKEEYVLIPNEAIRVRVIANSDNEKDIKIKEIIKDKINIELDKMFINVNNIDEVRKIIKNNLVFINKIVDKSLIELDYDMDFSVKYGLNYFPEKVFKGVNYNEGMYESLVITLGEGKGPNYWCVLYPPLCSIDNKLEKIEYKSFIKEMIDKYL